jgi:hypothetical protein
VYAALLGSEMRSRLGAVVPDEPIGRFWSLESLKRY